MPPTESAGLSLADLAQRTGAKVDGDASVRVEHVATLDGAGPGAIAFLANPHYRAQLSSTRATAVIVSPEFAPSTPLPKLVSANPYAIYAKVAAILHPAAAGASGVHPSAVIDASARVAPSAAVGPNASIGAHALVGERVTIEAGCVIGRAAVIGDDTHLYPHVIIYDRCEIGPRTIIHAGAVLGSDGFGMAEEDGRWLKIPQIGRVIVGADVEIGANTTIDRGAIDDTVIEDDVKLDNQIQIGHNCRIGAHTAIAGCVGIAGSTRIGKNCKIGGAAMITGHIDIADNVAVSAATLVFDSIREAGMYTGAFPALPHREWRQVAARVRRLRALDERIELLEKARGDKGEGGR